MSRSVPQLDIRLLGPPEVLVAGRPLAVDTRKAVAILALLAADGRAYARDELAALLWPESDETAAHGALRRTLSVMRRAIEGDALRIDRSRVALVAERTRIDLVELERLAALGTRAGLVAAADLARGPFMAGYHLRDSPDFDDWRAARAVAVERSILAVLDRLTGMAVSQGDLGAASVAAARRLDLDPLDEDAHVRLMELHAASGDTSAAIRQYRTCVAVLERELGVTPLATTTARYEAIREGEPAMAGAALAGSPAAVSATLPSRSPEGSAGAPPTTPDDVPLGLPLIGRASALAAIDAAVSAIGADSVGRTIVLTGEAGIGKSRLGEVATQAIEAAGGTVLAARGHRAETGIAYGAVVDLLRAGLRDPQAATALHRLDHSIRAELARLIPGIDGGARRPSGRRLGDPTAHTRLVGAVVDALVAMAAGQPPGALWLDDVQWLDGPSLDVLGVLARRLEGRPILLLLAWREDDLSPTTRSAVLELANLAERRVSLERLRPEEVAALVEAHATRTLTPAAAARLTDRSEGLPLYVVEALAAGTTADGAHPDSLPPGVRAVLRARVDAVDEAAAQVLAAAAVIGRTFDIGTVRHASGRSEDETVEALDRLVRRGIVREGQDGYDFSHGALRDLVEEDLGLARRRLLHRRVAEALRLDLAGLGRDDLGRHVGIAVHEREAGRPEAAAEAYHRAAIRAAELFAHQAVSEHAATAIGLGHPAAVDLHVLIGRARTRLGDYAAAVRAFEAAAARATGAQLPAIEWEVGRARLRRGDLTGADRHLAAVVEGEDVEASVVARAWVDRSVIRRRNGDLEAAVEAARSALRVADGIGDVAAAGAARRLLGLCALDRGDPAAAMEELQRAVAAADEDGDPTSRIAALVGLALATAAASGLDAAIGYGGSALDDARRIGDRHLEAAVENHLADILHLAGRDDEAREHQRRAVAAFAEVGGHPADPDPGIWMLEAV